MDDITEFAKLFQRFMTTMSDVAWTDRVSTIKDVVDEHLGLDCAALPVISEGYPTYDHVNVQVAVSAFLDAEERSHELLGLTGAQRHMVSFSDLVQTAHHMGVGVGPVNLVNLPMGPDDTHACSGSGCS